MIHPIGRVMMVSFVTCKHSVDKGYSYLEIRFSLQMDMSCNNQQNLKNGGWQLESVLVLVGIFSLINGKPLYNITGVIPCW